MRIAVAGGTGVVGRHVVTAVRDAGHEPVVVARSTGVDLTTGTGLDAVLAGVSRLVDVTNVTTLNGKVAGRFFGAVTEHLQDAGRRAGIEHHVLLSIVGTDRVAFGYYAAKRQQELALLDGDVPGSVLRATQFHEFAGQLLQRTGGPLLVVPSMLSQPIAAREVAEELVRIVLGEPLGMAPELAGPEQLRMPDLVRRLLRARGSRRPVLPLRVPGAAGRAAATGGLLPAGDGPRGRQTFAEWLATDDALIGAASAPSGAH
jgi:uncharacterized protein YbjT (DUF2867 family)